MRARYLSMWAALVLLVSVSGAWAQSANSQPGKTKGIDTALIARARAGDAEAEFSLSLRYFDLGNRKESCRWVCAAAENGDAVAQVALATFYENGSNGSNLCTVARDYAQAAIWYRKAADQGKPGAQFELGTLYQDGQGVPQDYAQAARWYRKAAEQGVPSAELNLGSLYAQGQGVPQDNAEAYFWFDLAATGEGGAAFAEIAAQDRDKAASHLTPADLSRVQERAREWFEGHPPTVAP